MSLIDQGAALLNLAGSLGGGRVERGIPYGAHDRQKLDVYHPKQRQSSANVLVFFYGGAWVKGSRRMYAFVGQALASRGMTTVVPDYRLRHHAQDASIEDGAQALSWVHANISESVAISGHSAGAHIAASLAYDPVWAMHDIDGFIGMAGPYDHLRSLPSTSSIPALLMVAARDRLISPSVSERFAERLRRAGADVQVRTYPRATHATLVGAISPLLGGIGPVRSDIVEFVNAE